jgi:hypothetical protein
VREVLALSLMLRKRKRGLAQSLVETIFVCSSRTPTRSFHSMKRASRLLGSTQNLRLGPPGHRPRLRQLAAGCHSRLGRKARPRADSTAPMKSRRLPPRQRGRQSSRACTRWCAPSGRSGCRFRCSKRSRPATNWGLTHSVSLIPPQNAVFPAS